MDRQTFVVVPGGLGYWVHPQSRRDVREIAGCADGVYLYATRYELRPYGGSPILGDAMKTIHDAGMEVMLATDFGEIFAKIGESSTYSLAHPETHLVQKDGRECACVNNPEFVKHSDKYYNWIFDNYEVDWLNYDEPTGYARGYRCTCEWCRTKLGRAFSEQEPERNADLYAQSFIEYLDHIGGLAKKRGKKVSAVCNGEYPFFFEELTRLSTVDMVGPDPYWFPSGTPDGVVEVTNRFYSMCQKYQKKCSVVIQGFNVPAGREDEIYQAGRLAARVGVDCMIGWFHWRSTGNPSKAWATTFKMLKDFKNGSLGG